MPERATPSRPFEPCCLPTTIGSMPHRDARRATSLMLEATPEIPSWVQLPKLGADENMMVQFTGGIPGAVREGDKVVLDAGAENFVEQQMAFFESYLAATGERSLAGLEYFALTPGCAAGFFEMLERLPFLEGMVMPKGQVTGPVTLGLNLLDRKGRSAYYDETLRDLVVKTVAMKARWQMRRLKAFSASAMMFLDEPALLGFGSSMFITIGRDDVTGDINEAAAAIHDEGGLAGVHCEENTDWSVLMATDLDILDFDAYDHLQAVTLYPDELRAFLDRGGMLGWGLVPTLDPGAAARETVPSLLDRFERGVDVFEGRGFDRELIIRRTLLTPSCGMGGVLTEPLAERVLGLLRGLSEELRRRHGFTTGP
jgi:hypothetical protein